MSRCSRRNGLKHIYDTTHEKQNCDDTKKSIQIKLCLRPKFWGLTMERQRSKTLFRLHWMQWLFCWLFIYISLYQCFRFLYFFLVRPKAVHQQKLKFIIISMYLLRMVLFRIEKKERQSPECMKSLCVCVRQCMRPRNVSFSLSICERFYHARIHKQTHTNTEAWNTNNNNNNHSQNMWRFMTEQEIEHLLCGRYRERGKER